MVRLAKGLFETVINTANLMSKIGNTEHFHETAELPSLPTGEEEVELNGPVEISADLMWTGKEIDAQVRAVADILAPCGRCLESVRLHLDLAFAEAFRPGEEPGSGDEPGEGDKVVTYFQGDTIDLSSSVAENIVLNLPMKPLCRSDCRGLCPRCGCNLNVESCKCPVEIGDPRLAVLGDLLKTNPDKPS